MMSQKNIFLKITNQNYKAEMKCDFVWKPWSSDGT